MASASREAHAGRLSARARPRATPRPKPRSRPSIDRLARTIEEIDRMRARCCARGRSRRRAAVARHRPPRPAARADRRSRGHRRPGGAALERLQRRKSAACGCIPITSHAARSAIDRMGMRAKVEVIADPAHEPGAAVFETPRGNLDASVESQLRRSNAVWPTAFNGHDSSLNRHQSRALSCTPGPASIRCVWTGEVTEVVGLLVESRGPAAAIGDFCEILTSERPAHPHPGDRLPRRPRALHAARGDRRPAAGRSARGAQRRGPRGGRPGAAGPRARRLRPAHGRAARRRGRGFLRSLQARRPTRSSASTSPSRWSPASAPSTACCPAAKASASASSAAAAWARARCSAPCRATIRPTSA